MRILVTGAKGQLGQDVVRVFSRSYNVYACGHEDLDITDEMKTRTVVQKVQPDIIVHCAAYTAVDKAEEDKEQAYLVNTQGTKNIAFAANDVGAKLCVMSTDYVFDGSASSPYEVGSPTNPLSVYGASKLAGETFVREFMKEYFIVRTSWVFGLYGNNFVKTMLKLGQYSQSLKVVDDQIGSPTYTKDLSTFLLSLVQSDKYGMYHASNEGACSWYEFAHEIFKQASLDVELTPCTTEEFPRPAPRPKYSVMSHHVVEANGFKLLPTWQEALRNFMGELREVKMEVGDEGL